MKSKYIKYNRDFSYTANHQKVHFKQIQDLTELNPFLFLLIKRPLSIRKCTIRKIQETAFIWGRFLQSESAKKTAYCQP